MAYSFTPDQLNALKQRATRLFGYQQQWMRNPARQRHYTKMRQCGADFAFSLEALIDAIETGRNQVFIGQRKPAQKALTVITLPLSPMMWE